MGSADVAVGGGGEGGGGGDETASGEAYTACLKLETLPETNHNLSMELHSS